MIVSDGHRAAAAGAGGGRVSYDLGASAWGRVGRLGARAANREWAVVDGVNLPSEAAVLGASCSSSTQRRVVIIPDRIVIHQVKAQSTTNAGATAVHSHRIDCFASGDAGDGRAGNAVGRQREG